MTEPEYAVVQLLGTKVVEVPDLGFEVVYVEVANVALVNPALDPAERDAVADWILTESHASATCPGAP